MEIPREFRRINEKKTVPIPLSPLIYANKKSPA
jgi:hypothetical protein